MSQVVLITNKRGLANKRKPEMGFGYKVTQQVVENGNSSWRGGTGGGGPC